MLERLGLFLTGRFCPLFCWRKNFLLVIIHYLWHLYWLNRGCGKSLSGGQFANRIERYCLWYTCHDSRGNSLTRLNYCWITLAIFWRKHAFLLKRPNWLYRQHLGLKIYQVKYEN